MAAPQILPDPEIIRKMLERGKTQREIADEFGVTKQAVSFHVRRRNLTPAPPRYDAYIPWRIKFDHQNSHKYHMLQAHARRQMGLELAPSVERQLDSFLRKLDRLNAVVDYTDEDGFYFTPRRPEDDGIIRDPRVA